MNPMQVFGNMQNMMNQFQQFKQRIQQQGVNPQQEVQRLLQTAQLLQDNAQQTANLLQRLNPTPIPAYTVQNPNCCGMNGCGCN